MIDIFVRSLLGPWGQQLLDFYLANSLWINGLILLYFGALVISRRSYSRSLAAIIEAVERRYTQPGGKVSPKEVKTRLAQDGVPWEAGLQATSWPFLAGPRGLWPRPKTLKTLQQLLPPDEVAARIVASNTPAVWKQNRVK
jgi:hypothetical protein